MAEVTRYVDDLDGSEIKPDQDGGPVDFAFDGKAYTIDLSAKNRAAMQKVLQPYIDKARRVTKGRRNTTVTLTNAAAVRAWAKEQGMDIPDRGRIPSDVRDAYVNAKK